MKFKRLVIKTMDILMLDCKQASILITKELENNIGFWEKWRLKIHTQHCRFCHNFQVQSKKIDQVLKMNPDEIAQKCTHLPKLAKEKKTEIIKKIKQNAETQ